MNDTTLKLQDAIEKSDLSESSKNHLQMVLAMFNGRHPNAAALVIYGRLADAKLTRSNPEDLCSREQRDVLVALAKPLMSLLEEEEVRRSPEVLVVMSLMHGILIGQAMEANGFKMAPSEGLTE